MHTFTQNDSNSEITFAFGVNSIVRPFQFHCMCLHCMVPGNIDTHSVEGHWKFQRGGGFQKPKL